jgi:hypothetical protein
VAEAVDAGLAGRAGPPVVADHEVGGRLAGGGQRRQRAERGRVAQRRITAAPDQLQHLGGELDLPYAAAAELYVVPGERDGRAGAPGALVHMDLPLDGVDVRDRGEIQVTAPDEGADLAQEMLAQRLVPGHRPGLDHRRPFPVLPHALVVDDGGIDRDGERRRRRVRPQSQIGAEDIAFRRAFLEQPHEVAREPDIGGARPVAVVGSGGGIVEQHEVDIRGVVQLPPAELAHAEHDEAAALADRFRVRPGAVGRPVDAQLAALGRGQQQMRAGEVDGRVGQLRQRAGDAVERPEPGEVGGGDDQRRLPLHLPQQRPHRLPRRAGIGVAQRREGEVQRLVRPALQQPEERQRLALRQLRQVGAVAAEAGEQRGAARAGGQGAGRGVALGALLHQAVRRLPVEGTRQALRREFGLGHDAGGKA